MKGGGTRVAIAAALMAMTGSLAMAVNDAVARGSIIVPGRNTQAKCLSRAQAARDALVHVNAVRARHGLQPLRFNARLGFAAEAHSRDQALSGVLSHAGSDGSDFQVRAQRAGFHGRAQGENVAWNQPTPARAVDAWARSTSHRRVLFHTRATMGAVGYACDPQRGHWWTLVVG